MVDTVTSEVRSRIMSRVRSKDTKAEVSLRKALHAMGFRYRLNRRGLPGTPDLVFPRRGAALFVHGCFWYRYAGCRRATTPSSNVDFWAEKFRRNVERDARKLAELRARDWRVSVVWECEVMSGSREQLLQRVATFLTGTDFDLPSRGTLDTASQESEIVSRRFKIAQDKELQSLSVKPKGTAVAQGTG